MALKVDTEENNLRHIGEMRTYGRPTCYLCGKAGYIIYDGLADSLYEVPGLWGVRKCVDSACGLVWLDPTPIAGDIANAYADYYTHYSNLDSAGFRLRQKIKKGFAGLKYGYGSQATLSEKLLAFPLLFSPLLSEQAGANSCGYIHRRDLGKLLEIGFGNGFLLNTLRSLGWEVEGVDFDTTAVAAARRNFNLNVSEGPVEKRHYPENYFDVIVMSHVIEHVHDPRSLLSECYRIIKPGGQIVIMTPNTESLGHRKFGSAWIHLDPPRHLNLFSVGTLKILAESCGLVPISLRTTARDANAVWVRSQGIRLRDKRKGQRGKSLKLKVTGKGFQIKERLLLTVRPDVGEEIILITTK